MFRTTLSFMLSVGQLLAGAAFAQDPTFGFVAHMGGTFQDIGQSVAVDASGNVYTTGSFLGTVDFDPGAGTYNLTGNGIFVSKLDTSGNLIWVRQMGAGSSSGGNALTVDESGNVYTTGTFSGTSDFDPGAGTYNLTSVGPSDIFVSKLDSSGNFAWARQLSGSTGGETSESVALDNSGNVYTTGSFEGTADFDPSAGTYNLTSAGLYDIFVSKLDSSGNFVWARRIGDLGQDQAQSVAVDDSGNVHTIGHFQGTVDFDPGAGTYNLTIVGGYSDFFVSKLDTSGNFAWARRIGSTGTEYGDSVALDNSGNVYTTGSFQETADFDPGVGTYNLTSTGSDDIFVSKLNSSGNFVWARRMGGTLEDNGHSIVVDGSENVYTTGRFEGTADFDPGVGSYDLTCDIIETVFVSKLDASGDFLWAVRVSGAFFGAASSAVSVSLDASGNVYTTGDFSGMVLDFDPGAGTCNLTSAGDNDIFVLKLVDNSQSECQYGQVFAAEWLLLAADLGLLDDTCHTPGQRVPERWGIQMVSNVLCQSNHPWHDSTLQAYANNLAALSAESPAVVAQVEPYKHVLAALLLINQSRQDHFKSLLSLQNTYDTVRNSSRGTTDEVLSDEGDLDDDGYSNGEEYDNVVNSGGSLDDFAEAALDPNSRGVPLPATGLLGLIVLVLVLAGLLGRHRWHQPKPS